MRVRRAQNLSTETYCSSSTASERWITAKGSLLPYQTDGETTQTQLESCATRDVRMRYRTRPTHQSNGTILSNGTIIRHIAPWPPTCCEMAVCIKIQPLQIRQQAPWLYNTVTLSSTSTLTRTLVLPGIRTTSIDVATTPSATLEICVLQTPSTL